MILRLVDGYVKVISRGFGGYLTVIRRQFNGDLTVISKLFQGCLEIECVDSDLDSHLTRSGGNVRSCREPDTFPEG